MSPPTRRFLLLRRRTPLTGLACLAAAATLGACGSSDTTSSTASSSGATASPSTAGSGAYGLSAAAAAGKSATTAGSPTTAAGTVSLKADATGALAFDQKTLTAKAGTVTVDMLNPSSSGVPHGIAVEGNGVDKDGKTVAPGGTSTVTLDLKPGTYSFYCPVPGHKQAGMKGTLTVR